MIGNNLADYDPARAPETYIPIAQPLHDPEVNLIWLKKKIYI